MAEELLFMDIDFKNISVLNLKFAHNTVIDYSKKGREKYLLHYITSGCRKYYIAGHNFVLKKGAVIFIPDGTKYITESEEVCTGIGINFDIENLPREIIEEDVYYKYADINYEGQNAFELMDNMYREFPIPIFKLKALLYYIFCGFFQKNINSPLKPAVDFINKHYNENLPVKAYADTCNLSESHFRKLFREYTGMSPIEFRNQVRFAEAKKLYQQNYSLNEIAEKTGFCDGNYFSKLYKRHTNSSLKKDLKYI